VARKKSSSIRRKLNSLVPRKQLQRLAAETGTIRRERKVGIVHLFWTLVLGFGVGSERTLAGLRRAFQKSTGKTLVPSAFYDRFTKSLVRLMKAVLGRVIEKTATPSRALRGALTAFKDVLATDSSVVRLHDLLKAKYPATRTNHTLAALKAHVILSVTGSGASSLKVTSERVHDGPVLRAGKWVQDRLLLFDLGYYRFQLFARIHECRGYFLTRLKDGANPILTAVRTTYQGPEGDMVGSRLQDVLDRFLGQVIDAEVELTFHRRSYGDKRKKDTMTCRLVGVWNSELDKYHLYLTNVPHATLTAEEVGRVYTARWLIELFFRELKSHYRLEDMPSSKQEIVETLLYAAFITIAASRSLLNLLRKRLQDAADRLPVERWAAIFAAASLDLLAIMVRTAAEALAIESYLEPMLLKEAVDPNASRVLLLERADEGQITVLHAFGYC
jgi:putative transposase